MAPHWLNESEMRAWRHFIAATALLNHALEADIVSHDLTLGDYDVLVRLVEADDGSMRMCDLAGALQLSPSGLTRRLDGLVRSGYVGRVAGQADRRVMYASLSDAGRDKLEAAAPDHVASVRRHLFDGLDTHQIDQMGDVFSIVHARLIAESSPTPAKV